MPARFSFTERQGFSYHILRLLHYISVKLNFLKYKVKYSCIIVGYEKAVNFTVGLLTTGIYRYAPIYITTHPFTELPTYIALFRCK
jgi:hypothetical protein